MALSLEIIYMVIIYFLSELIEKNNNKILWPSYLMSLNFLPSLISGILPAFWMKALLAFLALGSWGNRSALQILFLPPNLI